MDKDILKLINERHSVRLYKKEPINEETKQKILEYLKKLKEESGLDIRFIENTEKVFGSMILRLASWKNPPPAYFAFLGERNPELEQKCGYYGEKLVLFLQSLCLNTCWVGLFKRKEVEAETKKSAIITIAVGYGENNGASRKSKSAHQVSNYNGIAPEWFLNGVKCALLAPTAMNKQEFVINGDGNNVSIIYKYGHFANVDLGIVKYHFEQGAGKNNFEWIE